jgi:hypothetical protein
METSSQAEVLERGRVYPLWLDPASSATCALPSISLAPYGIGISRSTGEGLPDHHHPHLTLEIAESPVVCFPDFFGQFSGHLGKAENNTHVSVQQPPCTGELVLPCAHISTEGPWQGCLLLYCVAALVAWTRIKFVTLTFFFMSNRLRMLKTGKWSLIFHIGSHAH